MNDSQTETAIVVHGLNKRYGQHEVLRELELEVTAGSIHGLVGLNGSGKTTTLECMLGLQRFDSGEITVLDFSPEQLYRSLGRVVPVFDTPSLHPNLTVEQCLQQSRLLCEQPVRSVDEVAQLLGLDRYIKFKVRHLSLGNKRRTSIAQALLGNPELIILDEPFNGLDAEGVDDVLRLISQINQQTSTTFLLSSHQLAYLEQICTHVAILHQGAIKVNAALSALIAGNPTRVEIRTSESDALRDYVESSEDLQLISRQQNILQIQINRMDSAQLNYELVKQGIPVEEMILERASLSNLFRDITGGSQQ